MSGDAGTAGRVVGGGADAVERAAESALRPHDLDEFVGQTVVRE